MTTEKIKPKYYFDNPNTPKEIEQVLKKIVLEKLLSSSTERYIK